MRFLEKESSVAGPGYNRWLVPPAALSIHLCIGMAYGFSVFWLPLSRAIGVSEPVPCSEDMGIAEQIMGTTCDWKISMLGWMYTLFFVLLGSSAALWGGWMERVGPRKAGVVSALCWCGGLLVSSVGVHQHQLWLLWLGSGVIGGIGLGLGYISPISTLIKWFPDHRGMATGMAIMGFGGGAMIGAPLADKLMAYFSGPASVGVWQTFVALSIIYFLFMMAGALAYRIPPQGWKPKEWVPPPQNKRMITTRNVHVRTVVSTPQFWLVWVVLCMNVTAGIGIIGMASPLLQEIFAGRLIGVDADFNALTKEQQTQIAGIAAGFTGLLSLFNILGRFGWATLSDRIGRRMTYTIFLGLGCLLYLSIPFLGKAGNLALFVATFCIILSMYGGAFATVPAYLADLFGTQMVSAIHGRLLTAWATAGILGPLLVNYIREYQLASGVARADVYDTTMYLLGGLLVVGIICNAMIKPVSEKYFMKAEAFDVAHRATEEKNILSVPVSLRPTSLFWLLLAWLAVGIPLAGGIYFTVEKAAVLFGGR